MSLHVAAVDAGAAYECVCVRHAGARLNDEHHQIFMHNACAIGSTSLMRVLFRWLSNRNTHRIYLVCLSVGRFRPSVCHTGATRKHAQSPTPPQYVFWQKNERMINYDDSRQDISIDTTPAPRTQSRLIIREPQISDSGNYTCSASNTEPASIYVFVSKGECVCVCVRCLGCNSRRIQVLD